MAQAPAATGGTNAATSLTANIMPGSFVSQGGVVQSFAEPDSAIAAINALIKDDQNINSPAQPGSMWGWSRNGMLYVPNRGALRCLPGDVIMVDATTGWPILVSARAIAAGPWTTTAT